MSSFFNIIKVSILAALAALLVTPYLVSAATSNEYLQPTKAFEFAAKMADSQTIRVTFTIANGYYMYRERFAFNVEGARLGTPIFPAGKVKFDDNFQKDVETYRTAVTINIPVTADSPFTLKVVSQGCADEGLCYAPMESVAKLSPTNDGLQQAMSGVQKEISLAIQPLEAQMKSKVENANPAQPEMGLLEAALKDGKLIAILPLFFILGLGLSLTPCVLPMVPILSAIIIGDKTHISRGRSLALAVSYSLGMAFIYTAFGIAAGLLGEGMSAALQHPWVLSAFAMVLVLLSLSMFDVYQLQLPSTLQAKLMQVSNQRMAGKLTGVFFMGAISALIVSPCVAAPLAAALLYISQTHNVIIGGSALFALAAGMSIPLLLVGVSAGMLLPRVGGWMQSVKFFFGVLLLAMALWMVTPIVPDWLPVVGWAILSTCFGLYLLRVPQPGWRSKALGISAIMFGAIQLGSVATGGRDVLAPFAHLKKQTGHALAFKRVRSEAELDRVLAQAQGKTVMLDFYADWCVSCKEMERFTFTDPRVQRQVSSMILLQADVTANTNEDKALLKRFKLFGPPGIIFFDKQGREIPGGRVIGYQDAEKFLNSLSLVASF